MAESLLTTKMLIPPIPSRAVQRERLLSFLNDSAESRLILISAPAGFGKTTLVSMWARQASVPIAWLSLEEEDNDLARFLAYVISSYQSIEPNLGKAALGNLQIPQPPSYENILTSLLNDLAAFGTPIALVLDDYHLIQAQIIHAAISFMLDHLPSRNQLVLSTRADPPLPLARLRARGHLAELRQSDLRFTGKEAGAFLNNIMSLDLSQVDVTALETRTEGWIAGLQLAALSLQSQPPHTEDRSAFIQAFTGSHRYILDYLVGEVLERQPPILQTFLLRTSILERLCGPLCDALLDGQEIAYGALQDRLQPASGTFSGSQAILEHLETANLFIIPLDEERYWYRYHRLFSDLLRKRLLQTSPDILPVLHQRASEWYEQKGLVAAAIEHALDGQNFDRAATLIEEHAEPTLMRSEVTTFLDWMNRLPESLVRTYPTLSFFHAWALMMSGRSLEMVDQRLQAIDWDQDEQGGTGVMAGRLAALRAYQMLFQADIERAAELCQIALEHLSDDDVFLRSAVTWILSLARLADGDLEDGNQALQQVVRMSQEMGNLLISVSALCHQAKLQMRQGQLHRARDTLERALHLATDSKGQLLPIASEALIGLGELKREWNDLQGAALDLVASIEHAQKWSELASFDAYFPLAMVRMAQGDVEAAHEMIEAARQIAQRSEATEVDDLLADLQQAYVSIFEGDITHAMRWAERRGLMPGFTPKPLPRAEKGQGFYEAHLKKYEHLVLARLFLLQDRAARALELLEPILTQAMQQERIDLIIESQILRALAFQLQRRDVQALEALAEALSHAEPGGYRRVFLDEGEPMHNLLRKASSRNISPAYVSKLLAAFAKSEKVKQETRPSSALPQSLIEPLSQREIEVLGLLAAGLSNPEIAEQLVIAVSTVHSHCKNIYSKLQVHKRWDAVQRAQELGLI